MTGRFARQYDPDKERAIRLADWRARGANPADYDRIVGSIYPKVPAIQGPSRFDKVSKKDFVTELFTPEPEGSTAEDILERSEKNVKEIRKARAAAPSIFEPEPNPLGELLNKAFPASAPQPPDRTLNQNLFDKPTPNPSTTDQQGQVQTYKEERARLAELSRQLEILRGQEASGEL